MTQRQMFVFGPVGVVADVLHHDRLLVKGGRPARTDVGPDGQCLQGAHVLLGKTRTSAVAQDALLGIEKQQGVGHPRAIGLDQSDSRVKERIQRQPICGRRPPDDAHSAHSVGAAFRSRISFEFEPEFDIALHSAPGQQAKLLEHHGALASGTRYGSAIQPDPAAVRS